MNSSVLLIPGQSSAQLPAARIQVGRVTSVITDIEPFCDPRSIVRLGDIRKGDVANPNFGAHRTVSALPVDNTIGVEQFKKSLPEMGYVAAHPDVLLSLLLSFSGTSDEKTTLRRSFAASVRTLLCLPTTNVKGRGQVNLVCGQLGCDTVGGQRPFSIDYADGLTSIPGGIYSVLVMKI